MRIELLDWDSNFFGYQVTKVDLEGDSEFDYSAIREIDSRLIYVFNSMPLSKEEISRLNAKLVDTKLLLSKRVNPLFAEDGAIIEWNEVNDALINLAIQSGWYSRFKLDTQFKNNEFEKMYTTWVTQSIEKPDIKVYGYVYKHKLSGFITLSTKNNAADIGLIAVDETVRGMRMGTKLLAMADMYAHINLLPEITVNTQEENITALNFYIKNGFEIKNRTYIYHIWK